MLTGAGSEGQRQAALSALSGAPLSFRTMVAACGGGGERCSPRASRKGDHAQDGHDETVGSGAARRSHPHSAVSIHVDERVYLRPRNGPMQGMAVLAPHRDPRRCRGRFVSAGPVEDRARMAEVPLEGLENCDRPLSAVLVMAKSAEFRAFSTP